MDRSDEPLVAAAGTETFYRGSRDRYRLAYRSDRVNRCGWADETEQTLAYALFLRVVVRDGTVLDLGCGDGLLLQHLVLHAGVRLIPYGVDFLPESIDIARERVLPEFAAGFTCGNVATVELGLPAFTYIITSLDYVTPAERSSYVGRLVAGLEPGGRLVLHEHAGSGAFTNFRQRLGSLTVGPLRVLESDYTKLAFLEAPAGTIDPAR